MFDLLQKNIVFICAENNINVENSDEQTKVKIENGIERFVWAMQYGISWNKEFSYPLLSVINSFNGYIDYITIETLHHSVDIYSKLGHLSHLFYGLHNDCIELKRKNKNNSFNINVQFGNESI